MPTCLVILEVRLHGSAAGSTRDEVEAEPKPKPEAIAKAIKAWRKLRSDRTFAPLYSEPIPEA